MRIQIRRCPFRSCARVVPECRLSGVVQAAAGKGWLVESEELRGKVEGLDDVFVLPCFKFV